MNKYLAEIFPEINNVLPTFNSFLIIKSPIEESKNIDEIPKNTSNKYFNIDANLFDTKDISNYEINPGITIATKTSWGDLTSISTKSNLNFTVEEFNRLSLLNFLFRKEINILNAKKINIPKNINSEFTSIRNELVKLPFIECAVEINKNQTLKFSLTFESDRLLMITKDLIEINNDIFYSFFINLKLISADVTDYQEFIPNFKRYIFDNLP